MRVKRDGREKEILLLKKDVEFWVKKLSTKIRRKNVSFTIKSGD